MWKIMFEMAKKKKEKKKDNPLEDFSVSVD